MMKKILICFCTLLLASVVLMESQAQVFNREYTITRDYVYFRGQPLREANPRYFQDLGHGYGKDNRYVFLFGQILEYVDPATFRLVTQRRPYGPDPAQDLVDDDIDEDTYNLYYGGNFTQGGYVQMNNSVLYHGRKIEGASAQSFRYLGKGYAKDDWYVYFEGKKIKGASTMNFSLVGGFYATDNWAVYYRGRKVEGATTMNFTYHGGGYAEDSWNTYFQGRKL